MKRDHKYFEKTKNYVYTKHPLDY